MGPGGQVRPPWQSFPEKPWMSLPGGQAPLQRCFSVWFSLCLHRLRHGEEHGRLGDIEKASAEGGGGGGGGGFLPRDLYCRRSPSVTV